MSSLSPPSSGQSLTCYAAIRQSDYGKVILPFTVLRRLDCVLESTKDAVLAEYTNKQRAGINPELLGLARFL
ncbi:type I restriction-modification system subunit M N-terminal domain-containing protein [Methylomonas lenta]